MIKNSFYIAKKHHDTASTYIGYSWASGSWRYTGNMTIVGVTKILVADYDFIRADTVYEKALYASYYWFDSANNLIRSDVNQPQNFCIKVPSGANYFAMDIKFSEEIGILNTFYIYRYNEVIPHYKNLSKKYKRESNQMFFREELDGKINLFGKDFDLINRASINDTLVFDVFRGETLIASNQFNKTDCSLDRIKRSIQLKLSPNDKYSDILGKYGNNYDLVKYATASTWLTLTKRCIVQIYIQGENVISSYSGGTYWETDVDEAVDDAEELRDKYYFYPGPEFNEVNLIGFNYDINASYRCLRDSNIWNAEAYVGPEGQKIQAPCSIKFTKVYDKGEVILLNETTRLLSDGIGPGVTIIDEAHGKTLYDTYRIEVYAGANGTGPKLYQSTMLYGADKGFSISAGEGLYPMESLVQPPPQKVPEPSSFSLGDFVVEYRTWVRVLCDTEFIDEETPTYSLPYDDFAVERSNYKRCIGLEGVSGENSVIHIVQRNATSDNPTAYGKNDFGKYFTSPWTAASGRHGYYPLARSTWGNTSLWVFLDANYDGSFERWCSKTYKTYTTKDNYHIADVIKTLLGAIDPTIKHEATIEYSQFLYGDGRVASSYIMHNCQLYVTQKTNMLKGEYDQAAQKAEISLEKVMTMLRDCFRCYWFIDDQNRFRIEHVSFFMRGYTYGTPQIGLDLTSKKDKFNKKPALYCQQEIEYQKSDLNARFEFGWMDDVTDAMGNIAINFTDTYIPKDSKEDISISQFCPDVDYMLFKPDDFSNDGFALLAADINHKVPIVHHSIYDPKQFGAPIDLYTQNGWLSWRYLIYHRMYDAPGYGLELDKNEGPSNIWYIAGIARIMRNAIVGFEGSNIDLTKMIKTHIGNGYIEDMSVDLDTDKASIILSYEPT